ncbi:MAG: hypothetical protein U0X91_06565 [Spirosomataceae bacterium]
MQYIMNTGVAVEFLILDCLSRCGAQEEELKNEELGNLLKTLAQTVGFKEALAAPSLSKITAQRGSVFTEKLLGAIILHCWPKSTANMAWFEKQLFVRHLMKCYSSESAKDVLLAGTYAAHYKVRKSTTAGYLIELFKEYMNARAGYIERFYERKKRKYSHEAEENVHILIEQCPKLLPLVENFIEKNGVGRGVR